MTAEDRLGARCMSEIATMAETVAELARPGMRPKELISKVRKAYPKASKKEITRAAFYAVIRNAHGSGDGLKELHDLAMDTRNALDDDGEIEAAKD
jgi:hypothetical protein